MSPESPNVPEMVAVYEPGVVGLIEFVPSYVIITLSLGAKTAAPVPSVGAVRVNIRFCVPENTAPQADTEGDAANVSVLSKPVLAPWVKVTVLMVLLVKL